MMAHASKFNNPVELSRLEIATMDRQREEAINSLEITNNSVNRLLKK